MDKEATESADFYRLVAWLNANRKQVTTVTVAILVIAAGVGGFVMYRDGHEASASEALSQLKQPAYSSESITVSAADAQPFLKVAQDYPGTRAAGRALLVAGGIFFDAGKFDQAQSAFEQFTRDYPEDPLIGQGLVGVASSLEAQGKIPEATSRYEDLVKRHQADATTFQAKSALGRLYLEQNKPDQALQSYEELARANNNDTWSSEAGIQIEELLTKYPNLRKAAPAPAPARQSSTVTVPSTAK